jgi:hypothetical protein
MDTQMIAAVNAALEAVAHKLRHYHPDVLTKFQEEVNKLVDAMKVERIAGENVDRIISQVVDNQG